MLQLRFLHDTTHNSSEQLTESVSCKNDSRGEMLRISNKISSNRRHRLEISRLLKSRVKNIEAFV